jgi:hypothetical protein
LLKRYQLQIAVIAVVALLLAGGGWLLFNQTPSPVPNGATQSAVAEQASPTLLPPASVAPQMTPAATSAPQIPSVVPPAPPTAAPPAPTRAPTPNEATPGNDLSGIFNNVPTAASTSQLPAPISATHIRVTASGQAPNATDGCQQTTTFDPANVVDGNPETAWRVGGDGVGSYVQLNFDSSIRVSEVQILPGYAKVDHCTGDNRFTQNRRVKRVELTFSNGSTVISDLRDAPQMQSIPVSPVQTQWVKITILETYPQPAGDAGRNFTPISEVQVVGVAQ